MYFFLQRWFLFFLACIIMLQRELARFLEIRVGILVEFLGGCWCHCTFFFLLISSMGIDKKANEMMICLSSGCVQKAAAVSIARSRGIDFWGKPNLRVLSSREGRDGEASWRGSSGCPANLVSHLPFSSSLLHFFLSFGAVLFVRHCWLLTVTQEQEKWTGE